VSERAYSDAQIDASLAALCDPERLRTAQDMVMRVAPQLQHVLAAALDQGGWFGPAHEAEVGRAATIDDPDERRRAVRTLVAEETRVGMMVGVAVGYELAHDLNRNPED